MSGRQPIIHDDAPTGEREIDRELTPGSTVAPSPVSESSTPPRPQEPGVNERRGIEDVERDEEPIIILDDSDQDDDIFVPEVSSASAARSHITRAEAANAQRDRRRTPAAPLIARILDHASNRRSAFSRGNLATYDHVLETSLQCKPDSESGTSMTLSTFLSNNLIPLMPSHPLYPSTGTTCPICHDPFHAAHTPILVTGIKGCRNHIFGYTCLRKRISSGVPNSDKCPLCRTVWICTRGVELRRVNREWEDADQVERKLLDEFDEEHGTSMTVRMTGLSGLFRRA